MRTMMDKMPTIISSINPIMLPPLVQNMPIREIQVNQCGIEKVLDDFDMFKEK
jgi:hypothetical protein